MVEDQFDCTSLCLAEPKCYSFNMVAYPDSKGLYLCELLATDKYRETDNFYSNATFHHYSPWVSDKRIIFHILLSSTKTFIAANANFHHKLQPIGKIFIIYFALFKTF